MLLGCLLQLTLLQAVLQLPSFCLSLIPQLFSTRYVTTAITNTSLLLIVFVVVVGPHNRMMFHIPLLTHSTPPQDCGQISRDDSAPRHTTRARRWRQRRLRPQFPVVAFRFRQDFQPTRPPVVVRARSSAGNTDVIRWRLQLDFPARPGSTFQNFVGKF